MTDSIKLSKAISHLIKTRDRQWKRSLRMAACLRCKQPLHPARMIGKRSSCKVCRVARLLWKRC